MSTSRASVASSARRGNDATAPRGGAAAQQVSARRGSTAGSATPANDKLRRQRVILEVLEAEAIASQEELGRALKRRGHPVTQATLSRDLREMRVARAPVEGGYRYVAGEAAHGETTPGQMRNVAALEVTGIASNEIGVVVRTLTGRAQGVAVWIDGLRDDDVLGTIAGDDTILVLPSSIKKTGRLRANLARVLGLE